MIDLSFHFQTAAVTVSFAYQDLFVVLKGLSVCFERPVRLSPKPIPGLQVQHVASLCPPWSKSPELRSLTDLLDAMSLGQVLSRSISKEQVWMR